MEANFEIVKKFWHNVYGNIDDHDYNSKFAIYVTCENKHTWPESIRNIVKYGLTNCTDCKKKKKLKIKLKKHNLSLNDKGKFVSDVFPHLVKEWHPDNELRPDEITLSSSYKAKWRCSKSKCPHIWYTKVYHRTNKDKPSGCPYCVNRSICPCDNHCNSFGHTNPELMEEWSLNNTLDPYTFFPKSGKRVKWICATCIEEWESSVINRTKYKTGCPNCNVSKLEKYIGQILTKKKIEFKKEQKFKDCKHKINYRYDFYLPKYKLLIEADGIQHFSVSTYFGGAQAYLQRWRSDIFKNYYALQNGYCLLRLAYCDGSKIDNLIGTLIKELDKSHKSKIVYSTEELYKTHYLRYFQDNKHIAATRICRIYKKYKGITSSKKKASTKQLYDNYLQLQQRITKDKEAYRQLLSEKKKGVLNPNYGLKFSDNRTFKMSKSISKTRRPYTDKQILEVRKLLDNGITITSLIGKYKLTKAALSQIKHRKLLPTTEQTKEEFVVAKRAKEMELNMRKSLTSDEIKQRGVEKNSSMRRNATADEVIKILQLTCEGKTETDIVEVLKTDNEETQVTLDTVKNVKLLKTKVGTIEPEHDKYLDAVEYYKKHKDTNETIKQKSKAQKCALAKRKLSPQMILDILKLSKDSHLTQPQITTKISDKYPNHKFTKSTVKGVRSGKTKILDCEPEFPEYQKLRQ